MDGMRCRNRTVEITAQADSPVIRSDAYLALAAAFRVAGVKVAADGALPRQSTSTRRSVRPHSSSVRDG
jgi:hypothetical protein